MRKWLLGLVFLLVVIVDQSSKLWFLKNKGIVFNQGGVFGLFPGLPWTLVLVGVLGWMVKMLFQARRDLERLGLVLIVSGGLSNVIDRVLIGAVRDFIYYRSVNVWGNVADIVLTVGVGVLVIESIINNHEAT